MSPGRAAHWHVRLRHLELAFMRYTWMTVTGALTCFLVIGLPGIARAQAGRSERDVLLELFEATGGPGWQRKGGWGSDRPVCRWQGVTCGSFADSGPVTRLELWDNNLQGIVPESLAELRDLKVLDLSKNKLTGTLPAQLLKRADDHALELHYLGQRDFRLAHTSVHPTGLLHWSVRCRSTAFICRRDRRLTGTAVYQSSHCGGYCLRGSGPAPLLDSVSRALRRLSFESVGARYDSPGGSSDHAEYVRTATTWGNGNSQIVQRFAGQAPIDVWIGQQLLLGLVPTNWAREARRVSCKTLNWPGE